MVFPHSGQGGAETGAGGGMSIMSPDYKPKACWFPWNTDGSLGTRVDGAVSTCLGGVNLKYH
jgi:hypothetical protein